METLTDAPCLIPDETETPASGLPAFLILAALTHIAAFFAVQIGIPRPFTKPAPRENVQFASPTLLPSETSSQLSFWTTLHDPSILIVPHRGFLTRSHVWDGIREEKDASPVTVEIPSAPIEPAPNSAIPTLQAGAAESLVPKAVPFRYVTREAAAPPPPTTSVFGPRLRKRLIGSGPKLADPAVAALPAASFTSLRLAVDSDGMVRHAFVTRGSGNSSLDAHAVDTLRQARFRGDETSAGLVWDEVSIHWRFAASAPAPPAPTPER
jgi:TonB family protein